MGDQAFVVGGSSGYEIAANNTRMYDLSDNAWTNKTVMDYSRQLASCQKKPFGTGAEVDGYVFGDCAGGNGEKKCEQYDISENSWSAKTAQPINAGGLNCPLAVGYIWASELRYDIANNTWLVNTSGGIKSGSKEFNTFHVSGYVYSFYRNLQAFKVDVSSLVATAVTVLSIDRHTCATWDDGTYGYMAGGQIGETGYNSHYRYDPSGNSWAARTNIGQASFVQASFVLDGKGHSAAGCAAAGANETNYNGRYDNGGNSWTAKTVFPVSGTCVSGFYVPANFAPAAPTALSVSDT